jgi:hypothetical protein
MNPVTDPVEAVARAAAERLTPEYGPRIEADVEAALYARGSQRGPDQYIDPTALGSLIVSIATLAWTIYSELRRKTPDPKPEVAERTLRVQLRQHTDGTADSDKITEVVVAEIVNGTGQQGG